MRCRSEKQSFLPANKSGIAYRIEGTRHDAGEKLGFLNATVEFALTTSEIVFETPELAGP